MKVIGSEIQMTSSVGYGGTIDILGIDSSGNVVIADLKTSSGVYDDHRLQLAAYQRMVQENLGLDYVPKAYILRLDKETGEFEVHSLGELETEWAVFQLSLAIYVMHKEMRR